MNRLNLLNKLDGHLYNCKACERKKEFNEAVSPEIRCKGCQTYTQIRLIGSQLERNEDEVAKISLELYQDYKAQGLADKDIAEKVDMNVQYLSQLKKKWGIRPELKRSPKKFELDEQLPVIEFPQQEDIVKKLNQEINSLKSENQELQNKLNAIPLPEIDIKKTLTESNISEECYVLAELLIRKNRDYGNSVQEQFNEYGLASILIRLDDKLKRLKNLMNNSQQVKDESKLDTIKDIAGYAILGSICLQNEEERPL